MKSKKQVEVLLHGLNQIDDLLEYSYKHYDLEDLRDRILDIIDETTEKLKNSS